MSVEKEIGKISAIDVGKVVILKKIVMQVKPLKRNMGKVQVLLLEVPVLLLVDQDQEVKIKKTKREEKRKKSMFQSTFFSLKNLLPRSSRSKS